MGKGDQGEVQNEMGGQMAYIYLLKYRLLEYQ